MIVSFGDKAIEDLFHNRKASRVRRFPPEILRPGLQLLDVLNAARELRDLRSPPGNHLEVMKGEYKGFHSIRINCQWRVMFRWRMGEAREVRIRDYRRG